MEQMPLGNTGFDQLGCALHWTWERGWELRVWGRKSGAKAWIELRRDDESALTSTLRYTLENHLRFDGTQQPLEKEDPF